MLKNDYLLAKIGADTAENESFESGMIPKISVVFFSILRARTTSLKLDGASAALPMHRLAEESAGVDAACIAKEGHFCDFLC